MQKHIAFCGAAFAGFASLAMLAAGEHVLGLVLLMLSVGLLALDRDDQWPQHPVTPLTRVY